MSHSLHLIPEDWTTETSLKNAERLIKLYRRPVSIRLRTEIDGNTENSIVESRWDIGNAAYNWYFLGFSWGYGGTGPNGLARFFEDIHLQGWSLRRISRLPRILQSPIDIEIPQAVPIDDTYARLFGKGKNTDDPEFVRAYGEFLLTELGKIYASMSDFRQENPEASTPSSYVYESSRLITEIEKIRRFYGFDFSVVAFTSTYVKKYSKDASRSNFTCFIFINTKADNEYTYLIDDGLSARFISIPPDYRWAAQEVSSPIGASTPNVLTLPKIEVKVDIPDICADFINELLG
jgi:hypothetical protein